METLTFILRDNRNFKTIQIKENLETVGDLNRALRDRDVDVENVRYYEPKSQSSQLSSDENAKLVTQNTIEGRNGESCVVLSITTAGKNIDGGLDMSRRDMLDYLVFHGLLDQAKKYGKRNYTNLSNVELETIISDHMSMDNCHTQGGENSSIDTEEIATDVQEVVEDHLKNVKNLKGCTVNVQVIINDTLEEEVEEKEELALSEEELDDLLNF